MMVHLDDEVERAFRVWIAQRGGKKGDLSLGIERLLRRELGLSRQEENHAQREEVKGGGE